MKALVPIKRVADFNARIRVRPDGTGVDLANIKMSANPFDEIALEQAVRLREAGGVSEVIAVSIGSAQCQDVLRSALALGADRAILIRSDLTLEALAIAKLLAILVRAEGIGLAILGKQAIDDDAGQTGQMLAALLGWPQATFASSVELQEASAKVTREVDGGLQTIEVDLPAVITADLRLNTPRFVGLPAIMKAKQKPIEERDAESCGVSLGARLCVLRTEEPPTRKAGVMVKTVADLVDKLRLEAGVL